MFMGVRPVVRNLLPEFDRCVIVIRPSLKNTINIIVKEYTLLIGEAEKTKKYLYAFNKQCVLYNLYDELIVLYNNIIDELNKYDKYELSNQNILEPTIKKKVYQIDNLINQLLDKIEKLKN